MANVIYVDANDAKGFSQSFPLLDDIQISLNNTYESIGDLVPGISSFFGMVTTGTTLAEGGMPLELAKFNNILSYRRWVNTDPIKINVKLLFYVGQNSDFTGLVTNIGSGAGTAKHDVIDSMNFFIERATLSVNDGKLSVPGVSLHDILSTSSVTSEQQKVQSFSKKSKLLKLVIPGIVYLNNAYIETIAPTYSRQKTTSGHPIWGILDIQFSGVIAAMIDNFKNVPTNEANIINGR